MNNSGHVPTELARQRMAQAICTVIEILFGWYPSADVRNASVEQFDASKGLSKVKEHYHA